MPPPIGVVSGPLIETRYSRQAATVSSGSQVFDELVRLLAGVDLLPLDLALAAVGLLHGRVEYAHARAPDVGTGAVALDEGNDRMVGNLQFAVCNADFFAHARMISPRRVESPPCRCPQKTDSGCPRSGSRTPAPGCSGRSGTDNWRDNAAPAQRAFAAVAAAIAKSEPVTMGVSAGPVRGRARDAAGRRARRRDFLERCLDARRRPDLRRGPSRGACAASTGCSTPGAARPAARMRTGASTTRSRPRCSRSSRRRATGRPSSSRAARSTWTGRARC